MTLNPYPNHPSSGSYVLKLHRDARPRLGLLCGRIEHIVSGDSIEFANSEALLAWLLQHAAQVHAASSIGTKPDNQE
ncbi:hypothetical protein [Piscinibacter sp. XHJ-5]|uniref:hypothetical protein n=1 Tax=Piscinibacter sp. XHJ-5 TaxID=3037797 RepID=UPI002452A2B7|nr:hypothetical protein [Piscinibacter sp. XHJ-5]